MPDIQLISLPTDFHIFLSLRFGALPLPIRDKQPFVRRARIYPVLRQVERVRPVELRGVAVGGAKIHHDLVAFPDLLSGELGIVGTHVVEVAGDELDEAIIQYMKRAYNLMIGERTAEDIKIKIGSAYPMEKETTMEVKGRDLVAGLPKTLTITSQEVREALLEPINAIVESVRVTLERCPPELSADLVDRGLEGGGISIRNADEPRREGAEGDAGEQVSDERRKLEARREEPQHERETEARGECGQEGGLVRHP